MATAQSLFHLLHGAARVDIGIAER